MLNIIKFNKIDKTYTNLLKYSYLDDMGIVDGIYINSNVFPRLELKYNRINSEFIAFKNKDMSIYLLYDLNTEYYRPSGLISLSRYYNIPNEISVWLFDMGITIEYMCRHTLDYVRYDEVKIRRAYLINNILNEE